MPNTRGWDETVKPLNSLTGNESIVLDENTSTWRAGLIELSQWFRGAGTTGVRTLIDASSVIALNWGARTTNDATGFASLAWNARTAIDSVGQVALYWNTRLMADASGQPSLYWSTRHLLNSLGALMYDYQNQIFNTSATDLWTVLDSTSVKGIYVAGTASAGLASAPIGLGIDLANDAYFYGNPNNAIIGIVGTGGQQLFVVAYGGTNKFIVDGVAALVGMADYPNTRSDIATTQQINSLYTDASGNILSAPDVKKTGTFSTNTSNHIFYTKTLTNGSCLALKVVITGTDGTGTDVITMIQDVSVIATGSTLNINSAGSSASTGIQLTVSFTNTGLVFNATAIGAISGAVNWKFKIEEITN